MFAPVAGHLSLGVHGVESCGETNDDPVAIPFPEPRLEHGKITGEVIHIDRFGNLITNIPRMMIRGRVKPEEAGIDIRGKSLEGIAKSYSQKKEGELLSVIGGSGMLEISVNMGNAKEVTGARIGERVIVSFP